MYVYALDLEQGMCVRINGFPYVVVSATRVKYGKAALFIQADLRDVASGAVRRVQLNLAERLVKANLNIKRMSYIRSEGDCRIFRNAATDEEVAIPGDLLHGNAQPLEANGTWRFVYLDDNLYAALPPIEQFD